MFACSISQVAVADAKLLCADAFGRILSGTVKPGDKVRVLGEAYTPEDEEDSAVAEVTNVWVYQARYRIPLTKALAGDAPPYFCQMTGHALSCRFGLYSGVAQVPQCMFMPCHTSLFWLHMLKSCVQS